MIPVGIFSPKNLEVGDGMRRRRIYCQAAAAACITTSGNIGIELVCESTAI